MNVITHALLPVIVLSTTGRGKPALGKRELALVAIAGALPDLLHPHLSLEARMTSWSHGLPAWAAFTAAVAGIALIPRRLLRPRLVFALSGAYLLHIFCDAISGGINWAYPIGDRIWGRYWVHPVWWVPLDIACLLVCYFLFRLQPLLAKRARLRHPLQNPLPNLHENPPRSSRRPTSVSARHGTRFSDHQKR